MDSENPRQQQALVYAKAHGKITSKDLKKLTGMSSPTTVADLNELVKQGKLVKVGKYRGAYYEVVKENIKLH